MEECKELFKSFEGKSVIIKTQNNFIYHTSHLNVHVDSVSFVDIRGHQVILSLTEIKFISEENAKD